MPTKQALENTARNFSPQRNRHISLLLIAACIALSACFASAPIARAADDNAPDLSVSADQYPDTDAVILRWEQSWRWTQDGGLKRHEHKWVKLFNSRPYDTFADPRIPYHKEQDTLTIHTACTHLPDGSVLPVPDYSYNIAAPNDVGGWPAYAAWQDQIISFSGLQENAVTEWDYDVVTKPGVLPWVSVDLRIDDDYPVLERIVSLTVPKGVHVTKRVDHVASEETMPVKTTNGDAVTHTWTFRKLPAGKAEPGALPWRQRCPRLRFTTCASPYEWVAAYVTPATKVSLPDEAIRSFAQSAVEHEPEPREQADKIAKKLGATFNLVTSAKATRSLQCRPAAKVLEANYGNPLESAALLAAALRSLNLNPTIEVGADSTIWDEDLPTDSAMDRLVVRVDDGDEPFFVDPTVGVIRNPGTWGRHLLLGLTGEGGIQQTYIRARGEGDISEVYLVGNLKIDDEGKTSGSMRMRLTGRFYDPAKLETADAQKALVRRTLRSVMAGAAMQDYTVTTLSNDLFAANVEVGGGDPLTSIEELRLFELGDEPAILMDVHLPLTRSQRNMAVDIGGPVHETVDLTIELPDGWTAAVVPAALPKVVGDWGSIEQTVEPSDGTVRIHRDISIQAKDVSPEAYQSLQTAVNDLRATATRTLMCGPKPTT